MIERSIENTDWIIFLLIGSLALLSIIKLSFPNRFHRFINLTYRVTFLQLYNREIDQRHPFIYLSTLLNLINTSLFLYFIANKFFPIYKIAGWLGYVKIFTLYTLFVLGKLWIEKIVGILSRREKQVTKHIFEKLIYRNLISVYIFILNILIAFVLVDSINLLYFGIISLLILNLISLLMTYRRNSFDLFPRYFYFILYLCTLDLGPYILIAYMLTK